MEQSQPLRLEAKRVNRVAGWLLAVPVGFLWLLAVVFALLSFAALLQNGAVGLAAGLVTGLVVLLAILLTGLLHDALAVYEFTLQDVSKRSPFREQRANWSEVAGWAISESDGIWWLLDTKGRVLLSLEWHTLPEEQVPAAKAFVVNHLRRHFLAMPSTHQTLLSRLRHFHRLSLWMTRLFFAGCIGYWLAQVVGEELIALIIAGFIALISGMLLILARILLLGGISNFVVGRAKFLMCGDWLIQTVPLVTIHLPSVQHLERVSNGIVLVGADGQKIFIPSHLTALWDYLRTRLPSVGDLEERTSQQA
jgi:hypothetical protein